MEKLSRGYAVLALDQGAIPYELRPIIGWLVVRFNEIDRITGSESGLNRLE
jgi:hypothetical protein